MKQQQAPLSELLYIFLQLWLLVIIMVITCPFQNFETAPLWVEELEDYSVSLFYEVKDKSVFYGLLDDDEFSDYE
jgi:hypothetical protein